MTTEAYHRCGRCGDRYVYQGSGYGCGRPENDGTYCPSCKGVILKALATIPRKYEERWRDISELPEYASITLDQVLAWERAQEEEKKAAGGLMLRRLFSPLFNLETGDTKSTREVRGRDSMSGHTFRVSTWKQTATDWEITAPREYDLIKGQFTGHGWPR